MNCYILSLDYNNENMDHVLTVFREEIARRTITDIEKAGTLYRKAKSVILNNANMMNDVVVMSTVKMVKSLREQLKETGGCFVSLCLL